MLINVVKSLAPPVRNLLRILLVLITSIILTAVVLFFSFTSFIRQSLVVKSVNDINMIHTNFENMTNTAKSILLTFYYDSRTQQLMGSQYVDYSQIHKALLNVSSYYQHHPYQATYCLINRDTNYVFNSSKVYTMQEFPDQELLSILDTSDLNIKFKPIYRQIAPYGSDPAKNVFTYVYFDVYDNQMDPKIIVVNLAEDYFLEQIHNTIEDGSQIDLLNLAGDRIFTTESNAARLQQETDSRIMDLINSGAQYSIETINGQKTIVCCQAYSDIVIVKYTPYSYVTAFSFGFIRLSFIVSAILLLAIFVIVISSSFKLLKSFSAMHSRYSRMQHNTPARQKQTLLKEILFNASPITLRKLRSEFNDLFGTDQNSLFCVAICKIDRLKEFNETFDSSHRNSYLYSIVNVSEELFEPIAKTSGVILDNSTVAIVFTHLSDGFCPDSIEETFRNAIHIFDQQFQHSFSVAISHITTDINQAYQSASTLIPYRFLMGHQSVIFYSKVAANEAVEWHYPSEIEHDISRYISTQQWNKAAEKINSFVSVAKTASHEDARSAIHRLIYSIQITIDALKMSGICYPYEIQSIYSQFYEAEILDEITASLHEILHVMDSHDSTSEDVLHQNEQLVKDVKLYITEHYPEFNLSLSTIALSFHTSPNVLGRIFKALAGKPVFQYITQVRLKRAEELLMQSQLTNKEIALACGFENTSYFYSLFKQELGLTPSEYRKRHKA